MSPNQLLRFRAKLLKPSDASERYKLYGEQCPNKGQLLQNFVVLVHIEHTAIQGRFADTEIFAETAPSLDKIIYE